MGYSVAYSPLQTTVSKPPQVVCGLRPEVHHDLAAMLRHAGSGRRWLHLGIVAGHCHCLQAAAKAALVWTIAAAVGIKQINPVNGDFKAVWCVVWWVLFMGRVIARKEDIRKLI